MHRGILGFKPRIFAFFTVLFCDLIIARTVVTWSLLLHPKTIQTHRSSFQQYLIFALKSSSAVQAVGLSRSVYSGVHRTFSSYLAECPSLCGVQGPSGFGFATRERCRGWWSLKLRSEKRNHGRGCKIVTTIDLCASHWALTNLFVVCSEGRFVLIAAIVSTITVRFIQVSHEKWRLCLKFMFPSRILRLIVVLSHQLKRII